MGTPRWLTYFSHARIDHSDIPGVGTGSFEGDAGDITVEAKGSIGATDVESFLHEIVEEHVDNTVTAHGITLANLVQKTSFDAKGDLLVGSGADSFSKHSAGSNGTVPMFDSAQADGIKNVPLGWQAAYTWPIDKTLTVGDGTQGYPVVVDSQLVAVSVFCQQAPTGDLTIQLRKTGDTDLLSSPLTLSSTATGTSTSIGAGGALTAGDVVYVDFDEVNGAAGVTVVLFLRPR